MKTQTETDESRRTACKLAAAGGIAIMSGGLSYLEAEENAKHKAAKPKTNIDKALKYARNENSMPGKFPGRVVSVENDNSIKDGVFNYDEIYNMIEEGIKTLSGKEGLKSAWLSFVSTKDRIGLKVNPVAGKDLSTNLEFVKAVIAQLTGSGIPIENIIIWDRREFQLHEAGFTNENFPGIKIRGTEQKDAEGNFYDKDGKLYGEKMIDKKWYYKADVEGEYSEESMPYMINGGKKSYFTKIITQELDKIINLPILKNAGPTVTLAMKNLAYGSISNTARLHKPLWAETCAEVCAFPPLRDKVVLNIADGIKGCYQGGPGAKPQYFCEYKTILLATDPVAFDRIGYEIVLKKRIEKKIQEKESPKARTYMDLAEKLTLGVADINKIELKKINQN